MRDVRAQPGGPRIGINKNPYAIIALGGYGREEQCIHSDIDLLLLFKDSVPDEAEDLIREVCTLFGSGHGDQPGDAFHRRVRAHVAGGLRHPDASSGREIHLRISPLYMDLIRRLREDVLKENADRITEWLIDKNRERHKRFGDSAFLLEPNLKEGRGGLRDYHTLLWVAKIMRHIKQRRDLEVLGFLSHDEYVSLSEALQFIWKVRNRLHHMTGRKCDQLHFEIQIRMAEAMKYVEKDGLQPVNQFLGCLHERMEFIKRLHVNFIYELEVSRKKSGKIRTMKNMRYEGLEIKRGLLFFKSAEDILDTPELLVRIFEESARLQVPLSIEARRLVKDLGHLVDDEFRESKSVLKSFERILEIHSPEFKVFDEMLYTGFLPRYIPEFQGVMNRIQYDNYHLYPVDKHMLRVVQTIKNFGTIKDASGHPLCGEIYKELKNRKTVLWAALLHDIGKGVPESGHSARGETMARRIMLEKGYSKKMADEVAYLVREHLLLAKIAMRRDINDEETSINLARRVQDPEMLKMLYLLTVGDSIATGPKAWNNWTGILMRSLFLKVLNVMTKGELASAEAVEIVEKKREMVMTMAKSAEEHKELERMFNFLSPRYLLWAPSEEMYHHIRLFKKLEDKLFVWDVVRSADSDTRTVTICAKDAPGLISKIAGVFTLNGINILDVQVFTWRNNTALDIFKVQPPPEQAFEDERWARAAEHLDEALSGKLDLKGALRKSWRAIAAPGSPSPEERPAWWWTMTVPVSLPSWKSSRTTSRGFCTVSRTRCSLASWTFGLPRSPPRSTRSWTSST